MASISNCSVYLPVWKLKRDEISKETGVQSLGGEKAVAHWDEDSLTMAVEAAKNLEGNFDAVIFASISSPFRVKQCASFIASALDLSGNVFTLDISGVECDAEVERTFRLLFEKSNFRYYGWKARLPR